MLCSLEHFKCKKKWENIYLINLCDGNNVALVFPREKKQPLLTLQKQEESYGRVTFIILPAFLDHNPFHELYKK